MTVAFALALSSALALPQDEKQDPEARLKDLEKRVAEAEKVAGRLKELEAAHGALERRLAESERGPKELGLKIRELEKASPEIQARLKDLELARAALEKRAGEADRARQEHEAARLALDKRLSEAERSRAEHDAARAALERRIAEVDRARQELLKPIRDLETGRDALQKRVAEVDREIQGARVALETKVTESDRARQDQAAALERKVTEVDRRREELVPPVRDLQSARARLEQEARSLAVRLQAQEIATMEGRERALRVRSEVRETRLALLRTGFPGPFGDGTIYPNEDHFAFLGVVFDYLKKDASERLGLAEGEGIALRRIDLRTPAHESDLNHGDIITRVDGVPVRSSGVRTSKNPAGPWEDHAPLPTFLAERLPGERVRVEYVRAGETRQVEIELGCRKCAGACPFFTPPLPR